MPGDALFSVNWKNPMLLSDEHLRLADACAMAARRWFARTVVAPGGGFGLVSAGMGGGAGLRLSSEHAADRFTVHVQSLSALAPDGSPLIFDEQLDSSFQGALNASTDLERNPPRPQRIGVVVEPLDPSGEDPNAFLELGEPEPGEEPPRRPLRAPALKLSLEVDAFSSRSRLKVAEFLWDGVSVAEAEDYLPPLLSLGAWPAAAQKGVDLRRSIVALRQQLTAAAATEEEASSTLAGVVVPWTAAVASIEDAIGAMSPDVHPHQVWEACMRVLRVGRSMLSARPKAIEHALKTFVQPGSMSTGNVNFFEDLENFLGEPYDHDQLGRGLGRAAEMLSGLSEVVAYLLGSVPAVEEPVVETDVYYYKDKKYRLAPYGARTFEIDEAWHSCYLREMAIDSPRSLLLVCDSSLLVQNPRPNAGLWMLDKYERVKANMFRVNVDNSTDANKVVVLFQEIGEPTVDSVSVASRGLLDLSGLGPEPDERLRIYFES